MKRALTLVLLLCALLGAARSEPVPAAQVQRALLVGCDAFLTQANTAPSAQMNVERMARTLQTDSRGYARVTRRDHGVAGVEALALAVEEAFEGAGDRDTSLIYLCTHGLYSRAVPELVLSDGSSEELLTAQALREMLDRVPGRKILVLDACSSGAFIGKGVRGAGAKNIFAGPDYLVLTSAGGYEDSLLWHDRQADGGSYFAQELCEGLRTRAFDLDADGVVTMAEAWQGLLECHGASTAQVYPQVSREPLYAYDPKADAGGERPLGDLVLDSTAITGGVDTLYFSFTVHRPVRVQYQIIYYRDGQWRFDAPQIVEDQENAEGALSPGRKQRAVTLLAEDEAPTGYVLLQIVAQEGRYAMLAGSRLIAVESEEGDPRLGVWRPSAFCPASGEELPLYVRHAFPCRLTVRIYDQDGALVRRLAYKTPSRPVGERQDGSFFYWDGRDAAGQIVPAGEYDIEISCAVSGTAYTRRTRVRAE